MGWFWVLVLIGVSGFVGTGVGFHLCKRRVREAVNERITIADNEIRRCLSDISALALNMKGDEESSAYAKLVRSARPISEKQDQAEERRQAFTLVNVDLERIR